MNDNRLGWIDIGLHKYLLGWSKEVDLQTSYTALPRGVVMWDALDCEIEPTYYEDIV
tara:strand:- start:813 stop:983 length:171 start_codon:yes stop_codon:yes gene_type:complete